VLITVWVMVGLVAGVSGVAIGYRALKQARAALDECRETLVLQTSEGKGDLKAIRDVAVCRYDALQEMTGRLSFSIAMINGLGDGIVLTSINGRTETRTYVRPVVSGKGEEPLSPEEEQAVRAARLGHGPLIDAQAGRW
jgi:hypothetical protein